MKAQFLMVQSCALQTAWSLGAQEVATPYPKKFPLDQYLMSDRNSEIALARSAAPRSIAQDAEVLALAALLAVLVAIRIATVQFQPESDPTE